MKLFTRPDSLERHEIKCNMKRGASQIGGGDIFDDEKKDATNKSDTETEEETDSDDTEMETDDTEEEDEVLTTEDLEAFKALVDDFKETYDSELIAEKECLVANGISKKKAHIKAKQLLSQKWKDITKDAYANFLFTMRMMKKSPMHKLIMESIKENTEKGKSFYKAFNMAVTEYDELFDQLLGQEEEDTDEEETEEDTEEE